MSNVFFTSDVHFGHENIIKLSKRPFANADEMNEALIKNWNEVVTPTDTVWSLGDFAFLKISHITEILGRLNGNVHMVLGNHDHEILKNRRELLTSGLVKEIVPYKEVRVDGKFICLFHYAQRTWNKSNHGSWHLFGHTHGNLPPHGRSVDVGLDADFILGYKPYRPYSFEEVGNFLKNREVVYDYK